MYRRADLWRTVVLVVALLFAAVSTGAFAREFCAADAQNERHSIEMFHSRQFSAEKEQTRTGMIDPDRTNVALIGTMRPLLVGRLCKVERI
ncbi:hypothetical protein [Bradyrhizobium valentinum]|uniref:Uncharacterized protein n=1 Tax=Bradyrhizobium valentinum TaxID=1518501 RepID=A0A0R3LZ50_9BRAD|nr:hypothetical protein [Bradyrhizobium valentinum]KRR01122.1 hypothetical protein CP49_05750 [Bradyrhizobium valentinum]KRR13116.1 hypothetical protein CQ10_10375 [Bradyrhizobium valentinum]